MKGENECPPWEFPCWEFDLPYETESKWIMSFIREDTLERKIYNLPNSSNDFCETDEYLLFDFSLNIGDPLNSCVYETIWASSVYPSGGGIVDSINIIQTHDKLRSTIFTNGFFKVYGLPHETIIPISEGLGYKDYGIFYRVQSRFVDYCEDEIEQCNLILSNKLIKKEKKINIFPNPSNGIFQVSMEREKLQIIKVYSILGQLKKESKLTDKIDLSEFADGIYIMEIITENNERIVKKIKKEN